MFKFKTIVVYVSMMLFCFAGTGFATKGNQHSDSTVQISSIVKAPVNSSYLLINDGGNASIQSCEWSCSSQLYNCEYCGHGNCWNKFQNCMAHCNAPIPF